MSDIVNETDTKEIAWYLGKEFLLLKHGYALGQEMKYSSSLDMIGHEWDVFLKNGTRVVVVGDPVVINSPKYPAPFAVVKVLPNAWVQIMDLHQIND